MKKNIQLSELTLDELKAKKRVAQGAATGLGIVMLLASVTIIYLAVTSKKYSLIAVCVGCSLTFLPILINLRQVNNEISKRSIIK